MRVPEHPSWNFKREVADVRSRHDCDRFLGGPKYLKDGNKHCRHCREDTLEKRLLFLRHEPLYLNATPGTASDSEAEAELPVIDIINNSDITLGEELAGSSHSYNWPLGVPGSPVMRDVRVLFDDEDIMMPDSPVIRDLDDFGEGDDELHDCVVWDDLMITDERG